MTAQVIRDRLSLIKNRLVNKDFHAIDSVIVRVYNAALAGRIFKNPLGNKAFLDTQKPLHLQGFLCSVTTPMKGTRMNNVSRSQWGSNPLHYFDRVV